MNNAHDVSLVAIDPQNPKILYAATAGEYYDFAGLFKSIDAGNTWFPINTGLLDSGNPGRISASSLIVMTRILFIWPQAAIFRVLASMGRFPAAVCSRPSMAARIGLHSMMV
jgi:hypothetical protein